LTGSAGSRLAHQHAGSGNRYLQHSPVASLIFQNSLPRLPVPQLEVSMERYLSALAPLIDPTVLDRHKLVVNEFTKGEGLKLQKELVAFDKANKHTSYITDAWFDMYLKSRDPLPINFNPYIGLEMDKDPAKNNQLDRASVLIYSSARFMNTMRASLLKPDVYHMSPDKDNDRFYKRAKYFPGRLRWVYAYMNKAFPLDMSQYGRLFNSTRIPKVSDFAASLQLTIVALKATGVVDALCLAPFFGQIVKQYQ
jgi:carnitine O-palmitoyltransferase 2